MTWLVLLILFGLILKGLGAGAQRYWLKGSERLGLDLLMVLRPSSLICVVVSVLNAVGTLEPLPPPLLVLVWVVLDGHHHHHRHWVRVRVLGLERAVAMAVATAVETVPGCWKP